MAVCLVTGASGYIGSRLTRLILEQQHTVIALVRENAQLNLLPQSNPLLIIVPFGDVSEAFAKVFTKYNIEVVFHLAAHCTFTHSHEDIDALIDANIRFGAHLIEAMAEFNCPLLINTGSFAETGDLEHYCPQNLYAASKHCLQQIIEYYAHINKIKAITLRLMDVYGPKDPRNKIWPQLVKCLQNPQPMSMTRGEQLISPVHVVDVAHAFVCAWNLLKQQTNYQHQTFYVGNQEMASLRETVAIFEKVAGQQLPIVWGGRPYREREIMQPYIGNILPNWQPKINLEQGFASLMA